MLRATARVLSALGLASVLLASLSCAQHDLAPEDDDATAADGGEDFDYAAAQPVSEPGEPDNVGSFAHTSGGRASDKAAYRGQEPQAKVAEAPSAGNTANTGPQTLPDLLRQFWMEVTGAVILFVYLVTWWHGKGKNLAIAAAWEQACLKVFNDNFSNVGTSAITDGDSNGNLTPVLVQESLSCFRLFCRGKPHCTSCLTHLDLAKRQDALSTYLLFAFVPFVDVCHMEIAIDTLDTFSFCICRKKELKSVHSSLADLRDFARPRKVEELQDTQLCVISDSGEIIHAILQPAVVKVFRQYEELVQMFHVSDGLTGLNCSKGIHATFCLPVKPEQMEAVASLVRLTLYLIDVVATFRLSEKAKKQVVETRRLAQKQNEVDKRAAQELRMQQKKLEKKKLDDATAENLGKEALRKREEKEYKRSLKAKLPRMKMTR